MTAETSNARGEWVLVPRNPTEAMIDAWRDAPDIWEDAYAAMLAAAPQPPSAPVGVELSALRVQEWLHREHDILCPVQEIEQAMRTPCSCPLTERALAQQPAAVDEAYPTPRNRAEAVALAKLALAHLGVIDAHIDAAIARCETDFAAQQPAAVDRARFRKAPCYLCGYNGPGYFQPETHPCAATYHADHPGGSDNDR